MNGGLHAPLLARGTDKEKEKEEEEEDEEEEKKHEVISWKKEEEDQGFKEWMSNVSSKDVTVFVSFLLCTFFQGGSTPSPPSSNPSPPPSTHYHPFQVYVGAKCVNFAFPSEFLQGWLMGSAIIWINAESTLLGNLSECSGVLGRALALKDKAEHAHVHGHGHGARRRSSEGENGGGLEVTTSAAGSHGVTSGTKKTTRGPSSKQQGQEEALDESALRGDKGIRLEKVLTPRQYLLRSIGLAYKELPLIVTGFTCLAVTSGAGLLIPTYQGHTVDDMKDGHVEKGQFHRDMLAMALCSLITGIFSGLRGLFFSTHPQKPPGQTHNGALLAHHRIFGGLRGLCFSLLVPFTHWLPSHSVPSLCPPRPLTTHHLGRIVDDVKDGHVDKAQFHRDVLAMALCSLITGIFGGLRGLCFSVVGKRVLKTLQDKLFEGVIIQDIAYFDSTTTGELTSRLTNDVAAMSEPINWQLSALVRNLASLVGGVLLCFVTSWKLSILAFTTMAPILHITAVYSRWSRDLNRKRYAPINWQLLTLVRESGVGGGRCAAVLCDLVGVVLAEANSAASEALSNIRTVRAFSTETVEREQYESKTMAAHLCPLPSPLLLSPPCLRVLLWQVLAEANSAASEALSNIRAVRAFSTEGVEREQYESKTMAAMSSRPVLAEANSAASEALSNIRTVRAFSTEGVERERYESKTMAAMAKGVRDALAYSGAVAINNWLDLGASVLILWWVGSAVVCWGCVGGMWVGRTDALAYSGAVSINSWLDLGASVLILWWVGSAVVCWGYVGGMWVGRTYGGVLVTEGHMRLDQLIAFQLCWNLIQYGGVLVMEGHMRLDQLIAFQLYWNLIQSGYGGVLVMEGHMRLGQLIAFQLYWNLIQSGYQSIMSVLMSLTKASGAAQRVLSLIDSLPDIDPDAGTKVSTLQGSIRMEDVHFHYQMRPDHPVLKGVSFHVDPGQVLAMVGHSGVSLHVDPGQVLALVGRSGGGKSTVVHLLMRFYDPVQGRIVMDGRDLRELNLRSVHAHMGLVAQDTQMWACSIEENIAYGLPSYTRAEVEEAAKHANAHDFITKFPEGYATRVGERGVRLSGGQRQRIAIARMLLRRPRVLLLDEATSALDAESEALVQGALDRLIAEGGRTIVLVAHRLSTVRNADSICVLEGGRVAEHGTHEQLLEIRECRWVVEGRDELLFLVECVYSK
ncbi:unnamed protein product [Closterium sp. NIES-65]|nr:unnamed protein product [Closterium sp. NIES-65]